MQIIKNRLKNALNNKIIQSQLTPYNIFYVILNSSETITKSFKKKRLTKLLFKKEFNSLKNNSYLYPICYISGYNSSNILEIYDKLKNQKDFKKILITSIKLNFLIFKEISLIKQFSMHNNLLIFYKTYFLLNRLLTNFIFLKKSKN